MALFDTITGGSAYDKGIEQAKAMAEKGAAALKPYSEMGARAMEEYDQFLEDPWSRKEFTSTFEYQTKLARQRLAAGSKLGTRLYGEAASGIFARVHSMIAGGMSAPLQVSTGAAQQQAAGYMNAASTVLGARAEQGRLRSNVLLAGMGSAAHAASGGGGMDAYRQGYGAAYRGASDAQADVYGAAYYGWT